MEKNYAVKLVLVCFCLIFSCSESDDSTTAVSTETNPDNAVITQNSVQDVCCQSFILKLTVQKTNISYFHCKNIIQKTCTFD